MKGKAFKFGDNISTDHIAPGRLFHLRSNLEEFSKHVLEDADPDFASTMNKGDFVVAGNNFGDVNTTAGSTYHVESALNQDNNQTISTINNNFNTSGSNGGGFGYEWNPTSTTSYANGVNVVNNAMSGDTTPLQKSNGDFQGNTTNNINGIQVATFLQSTFKDFTLKMREVLYGVFKPYLLPVNDLDNNVEGFNW